MLTCQWQLIYAKKADTLSMRPKRSPSKNLIYVFIRFPRIMMLVCLTIQRIAHFKDNLTKTAMKTFCECTHGLINSLKLDLEVRIVVNVCVPVLGAAIVAFPIDHLPLIIPYTMSRISLMSNSLISYQQCHILSLYQLHQLSSTPVLLLSCSSV